MDSLNELIGKKLGTILSLSSGVEVISFGKRLKTKDWNQKEKNVREYVLYSFCPIRIKDRKTDKILLGTFDIFAESTLKTGKYENLFEQKANRITKKYKDSVVENVELTQANDLKIYLSNDLLIEIFIDCSSQKKLCWEIEKYGSGKSLSFRKKVNIEIIDEN